MYCFTAAAVLLLHSDFWLGGAERLLLKEQCTAFLDRLVCLQHTIYSHIPGAYRNTHVHMHAEAPHVAVTKERAHSTVAVVSWLSQVQSLEGHV